jgi:hypothetical protein
MARLSKRARQIQTSAAVKRQRKEQNLELNVDESLRSRLPNVSEEESWRHESNSVIWLKNSTFKLKEVGL